MDINELYLTNSNFFSMNNNAQAPKNNFNGRVFLTDDRNDGQQFEIYKGSTKPHHLGNRVKNILETTPVSDLFFSRENVDRIQLKLKEEVIARTNADNDPILKGYKPVIIKRQNDTELGIIMRSIYLQYSKNIPYNIEEQVDELNNMVIYDSVPKIITSIKQKIKYYDDIQMTYVPLDYGVSTTTKGENNGDISELLMGPSSGTFDLF